MAIALLRVYYVDFRRALRNYAIWETIVECFLLFPVSPNVELLCIG